MQICNMVGLSRPKEYMEVITDNKEKLKSQVEKSQVKKWVQMTLMSLKRERLDPDAEKSKEVKNVSQLKEENIVNNKNEVLEKFNSKLEEKNVDPKNITNNATAKEGEDRTVKFKINDNETKVATVTLGDNNKIKDVDIRREASSNLGLRMPDIKKRKLLMLLQMREIMQNQAVIMKNSIKTKRVYEFTSNK